MSAAPSPAAQRARMELALANLCATPDEAERFRAALRARLGKDSQDSAQAGRQAGSAKKDSP